MFDPFTVLVTAATFLLAGTVKGVIGLGLALGGNGLLTGDRSLLSVLAVAPALVGMVAGQRVRRRLSEGRFRRVFFSGLLVVGAYIVVRALA